MSASARHAWLVSPAFDLAFVANLGWLVFLIPGFMPSDGGPAAIDFWQVYFLTTPHRWITLLLVASDPDRRGGRSPRFAVIAIAAAAVVAGAWLTTGAFQCLAMIDFVWNNWHFASQHGGILRMYSRKAGGGRPRLETWGVRVLVMYVTTRLLGWPTGWLETAPQAASLLPWLDGLVFLAPLALVALELRGWSREKLPKLVYLLSVSGLYGTALAALALQETTLVLALRVAAAVFHAVEYLAIVTHYAWRRQEQGSAGLFRRMALHWLLVLATFVVGWGLFSYAFHEGFATIWLGLNLWASALHYAYDGLIWKLRKPATAQALGVELAPAAS